MKLYTILCPWILSLFIIVTSFVVYPCQIVAQDVNWDIEFEQGFTQFQQGNFGEALPHLEKIANALPLLDAGTEVERTVYFVCGMCAQQMGDLHKSIVYNSKALELQDTPIELTIQLWGSQLQNYSELSMNENCVKTVERMMDIYRQHKYIDLVQSIMTYYSGVGDFKKVTEFEKDLSEFILPVVNSEMDEISNTIQWNTIYMSLAHSYKEINDLAKALHYYQKAATTITEYKRANLSLIYAAMSQIYELQGDKSSALKYQKLSVDCE